jgi:hypothetical protein
VPAVRQGNVHHVHEGIFEERLERGVSRSGAVPLREVSGATMVAAGDGVELAMRIAVQGTDDPWRDSPWPEDAPSEPVPSTGAGDRQRILLAAGWSAAALGTTPSALYYAARSHRPRRNEEWYILARSFDQEEHKSP